MKITERKQNIIRILLIVLCSLVLGFIVEMLFNVNSFNGKYNEQIDLKDAKLKGCTLQNGSVVLGPKGSTIEIKLDNRYLKKLTYSYNMNNNYSFLNAKVNVTYSNMFGKDANKIIEDNNPYINRVSTVNINKKVSKVILSFDKELNGVIIDSVKVSNEFRFSKERFLFFVVAFFIVGFLFLFKNVWTDKIENIFLVLAFTIGTLFVIVIPTVKTGWDEDVHFKRAYTSPFLGEAKMDDGINEYCNGGAMSWPFNIPQSKEEKEEFAGELGTYADYTNTESSNYRKDKTIGNIVNMYSVAYITQGIGIKLGQLFKLNFVYVYMMGRWFNLITYIALMYFAIKKLKVGKRILSIIALMPTTMYLATCYSYDAFITGCISIALAYMLNELVDHENKMSVKSMVMFILFMCIGCLSKAVYIPLILIGLLLKKDKFKNKKQARWFRIAVIIGFLVLMSTFVIPSLIPNNNLSDVRGGNTDAAAQIRLIISQPISYFVIWLKHLTHTFVDFTIGESVFALMGHLNASPFVILISLLMLFVILTDSVDGEVKVYNKTQKVVMSIIMLAITGLIWTALYLSFNEVGIEEIHGVQARYYTPMLIVFYTLFLPKKIKNNMKPRNYNTLIYTVSSFILLATIYVVILEPYCI